MKKMSILVPIVLLINHKVYVTAHIIQWVSSLVL